MSILVVGDLHGDFRPLHIANEAHPRLPMYQVGDFGYWPQFANRWNRQDFGTWPGSVSFIDGNHDYTDGLPLEWPAPSEVWPSARYLPRGYVEHLPDGRKMLCLGGSKSVDRYGFGRVQGDLNHGWFESEQLTAEQARLAVANADAAGGVDLMLTHTPPDWFIRKHFSKHGLKMFGIDPETWIDESARLVEFVWKALEQPPLICGHMHRSLTDGNVRLLDINEYAVV